MDESSRWSLVASIVTRSADLPAADLDRFLLDECGKGEDGRKLRDEVENLLGSPALRASSRAEARAENQRKKELLDRALDLKGQERQDFLRQVDSETPGLRQELESLLDEEAALDDGFLGARRTVSASTARGIVNLPV